MAAERESSAFKALVRGRVQGVFFRDFVCQHARRNAVVGSVRNLPEGTVEVYAEGEPEALNRLIAQLWEGPSDACVTRVEVQWRRPLGDLRHGPL